MQALSASPESLAIVDMIDTTSGLPTIFLNIGLANGVLLRTSIDNVTGALSDTRIRFLGGKAVKLFPLKIANGNGVLALSTRPWVAYTHQSKYRLMPLSYEMLEYGSGFCSEQCTEGIIAITGNTLRILSAEKLASVYTQTSIKLKYTPRRMIDDENSRTLIVLESEYNAFCASEKKAFLEASKDMDLDSNIELDPEYFGMEPAGPGKWASCIRLVDPSTEETLEILELDENEAAIRYTN
jgi:splicing factor 3B subunit 3